MSAGRDAVAEVSLRRAVTLSGSRGDAVYATNLALALLARTQFERAATLVRRVMAVLETTGGPSDLRRGLIFAALSACAAGENKPAISEAYARQARQVVNLQAEPDTRSVALILLHLAGACLQTRKTQPAEEILEPAIAAVRKAGADNRPHADGLRLR